MGEAEAGSKWMHRANCAEAMVPKDDEVVIKRQHYEELLAGLTHVVPDGKKEFSGEQLYIVKDFIRVMKRTEHAPNLVNALEAILRHLE